MSKIMDVCVAEAVECLLCKWEALSSKLQSHQKEKSYFQHSWEDSFYDNHLDFHIPP
jgi:hypothetical protein